MDACNDFRERWLAEALFLSDSSADAHPESCESCAAWLARRLDQSVALSALESQPAPDELEARVAAALAPAAAEGASTAFEERLQRRLAGTQRHRAPEVLDRLVAEELADPKAARVRRFVGDMDRPAVPGALAQRLGRTAPQQGVSRLSPLHGAARRGWAWGTLAAAALVTVVLLLGQDRSSAGRPFEVRYGMPDSPSPLAAGLAQGWNGGIVSSAVEGGR